MRPLQFAGGAPAHVHGTDVSVSGQARVGEDQGTSWGWTCGPAGAARTSMAPVWRAGARGQEACRTSDAVAGRRCSDCAQRQVPVARGGPVGGLSLPGSAACSLALYKPWTLADASANQVWINQGDIILLSLRDFQDDKADVIQKYTADEARNLKQVSASAAAALRRLLTSHCSTASCRPTPRSTRPTRSAARRARATSSSRRTAATRTVSLCCGSVYPVPCLTSRAPRRRPGRPLDASFRLVSVPQDGVAALRQTCIRALPLSLRLSRRPSALPWHPVSACTFLTTKMRFCQTPHVCDGGAL
jgi:hypothetical protein